MSKCKAIFAVKSFRNSSAQFFKLAWCSTLVSCPTILSANISTSHCLKQFCESVQLVFSLLMLFWLFIILKLGSDLFVESARKNNIRQFMKRKSISYS